MMKRIRKKICQTILTDFDKGTHGNCGAACVSSMTGVPIESWPENRDLWDDHLAKWGWIVKSHTGTPPEDGHVYMSSYHVPEIVWPKGIEPYGHVVLVRNGKIIFDPRCGNPIKLGDHRGYYFTVEKLQQKIAA